MRRTPLRVRALRYRRTGLYRADNSCMRLPRRKRLAMTQKGYPICHCEERSDVAIFCTHSAIPTQDCYTHCAAARDEGALRMRRADLVNGKQ